jgi:hypothetical protein
MNAATESILTKKVNELNNLPAMPSVLSSLGECLSQSASKVDVGRVVELISYDKSLAAQCLRICELRTLPAAQRHRNGAGSGPGFGPFAHSRSGLFLQLAQTLFQH